MASATPSHSSDLRIVLLGRNGAELSSVGNMILGRKAFKEKIRVSEVQRGRVDDRNISVIDTPGFFSIELTDEDLQNEMMKSLSLSYPGPHVFLLIVKTDTFREDYVRKIIQKIEENFGAHVVKFTLVLFIRERMSNRDWMVLKLSKTCQDLISHFRGKNHMINSYSDTTEISTLLEKINDVVKQNNDQHYNKMFQTIRKLEQREKHQVVETIRRISFHEDKEFGATSELETRLQDIRIGMASKSRSEKTAARNIILGKNLFKEGMSSDFSHHTKEHYTYEMYQEPLRKHAEEQNTYEMYQEPLRKHAEEHYTYEMYQELLRKHAEEQNTYEMYQEPLRKHAEEHYTYELYQESLRKCAEEQEKERDRDKHRRAEEQRSREKKLRDQEEKLRIQEKQLKKQEEELRAREEEQREKEEREKLKKIHAEMRMKEIVQMMSMRNRSADRVTVLAALIAAVRETNSRHMTDQDKNRNQYMNS